MGTSILLRCRTCTTVNRVPVRRLQEHPHCGKCKALLEFPRAPVEATASTFSQEVLQWPGAALVEFWSPRCSICRSLVPEIRELAFRRAGRLKVVTINADQERTLSGTYSISAVPTFILYRNGVKLNELNGGLPGQQLEQWIDASLGS